MTLPGNIVLSALREECPCCGFRLDDPKHLHTRTIMADGCVIIGCEHAPPRGISFHTWSWKL